MSRIARGDKRPLKAAQFKFAELKKNRGAFLEKRLARLDKGEATKRISAAREKLMQQKQAAQGGRGGGMPRSGGGGHRNKN